MSAPVRATACVLLVALLAGSASGQHARDVIVIGEQRYQRTEQLSHTLGPSVLYHMAVAARDGRCAYVFERDNDAYDYLTQFDSSAARLHQAVLLEPEQPVFGSECVTTLSGSRTWTAWYLRNDQETWGAVFDASGQALGLSFLIADGLQFIDTGEALRLDTNGQRVAVAMVDRGPGGNTQEDIYVRFFDMDGGELSDLIALATDTWYSEEEPSVAVLNDGTTIVAYKHGRRSGGTWHVCVQRISPDLSIEAPVQVDAHAANGAYVRALDDGTFLVAYRHINEYTSACLDGFIRHYSADCTPLGDPVQLDRCYSYAAATSDGRFALAGYLATDTLWVQLYDSDAQALCDPFDFTVAPYADDGFNLISVPLAYDDDGTVWIAWRGDADELITTLRPLEQGDTNCDGVLNFFDIDPFILALTDPSGYAAAYPECDQMLADIDGNGTVNNFDIDPFVAVLVAN